MPIILPSFPILLMLFVEQFAQRFLKNGKNTPLLCLFSLAWKDEIAETLALHALLSLLLVYNSIIV